MRETAQMSPTWVNSQGWFLFFKRELTVKTTILTMHCRVYYVCKSKIYDSNLMGVGIGEMEAQDSSFIHKVL